MGRLGTERFGVLGSNQNNISFLKISHVGSSLTCLSLTIPNNFPLFDDAKTQRLRKKNLAYLTVEGNFKRLLPLQLRL